MKTFLHVVPPCSKSGRGYPNQIIPGALPLREEANYSSSNVIQDKDRFLLDESALGPFGIIEVKDQTLRGPGAVAHQQR